MNTIELFPEQVRHKDALVAILKHSPFALDFSMLGTGKTYTSSALFKELGFANLVVVAPVSVITKWNYMDRQFGIKQHKCVSFSSLRSVRNKQPKHGLLTRKDTSDEGCKFTCTQAFLDLVSNPNGVLFVIDEIQNIKNENEQQAACRELIRPIVDAFRNGGKSRVLLLSGSPVDKKVQIVHLFKTLHVMKQVSLCVFNPAILENEWRGMHEIETYARKLDESKVTELKKAYSQKALIKATTSILENYSYDLFQQIIKVHISSAMLPLQIKAKIVKQNGFYYMDEPSQELFKKGCNALERAVSFNSQRETVDFRDGIDTIKAVQKALQLIENSKIITMIRVIKHHLQTNSTAKVAVCVNYKQTIADIVAACAEYRPLIFDGSVSKKDRAIALSKFQAPNLEHRLFVANIEVANVGIDLDDQHGGFPRFCLVNPNYHTIKLYQLGHRFHRSATKSDSVIHFVFGMTADKGELSELPVLRALSRKSGVMKETTSEQERCGIVFPGDYEKWTE